VSVILCDGLYDPLADAGTLMVLADSKEFACADLAVVRERMRGRVIVDSRGVINGDNARADGFTYLGVGDRAC
jgi:UDP-glucose 6-dehydrogenase